MSVNRLEEAIALVKGGKPDAARPILLDILRADPRDEIAWMYLVKTMSNQVEQIEALKNCLKLNPQSNWAQKELARLQAQSVHVPPFEEVGEEMVEAEKPAAPAIPPGLFELKASREGTPAASPGVKTASETPSGISRKKRRDRKTIRRPRRRPLKGWQKIALIAVPLILVGVIIAALVLGSGGLSLGGPSAAGAQETQATLPPGEAAPAPGNPEGEAAPAELAGSAPEEQTPARPTPRPTVKAEVQPIPGRPVISPANADQLGLISQWFVDEAVAVAFSLDGRWIAAGAWDGSLHIWSLNTLLEAPWGQGGELYLLDVPFGVNSVAFSPDGSLLAFGMSTVKEPLRLVDLSGLSTDGSGREPRVSPLSGHTDAVKGVAFSPDGYTLASSSFDNSVRLWDVASGEELVIMEGHQFENVAFSPDGTTLAAAYFDAGYSTILWDTLDLIDKGRGDESRAPTLTGGPGVAFSPDGTELVTAVGKVTIWDASGMPSRDMPRKLHTIPGHTELVQSLALSPDGRVLATGSRDKTIKLWDLASGRELATLAGHEAWVRSLAFSPDGRVLASASEDGTVRLWAVPGE